MTSNNNNIRLSNCFFASIFHTGSNEPSIEAQQQEAKKQSHTECGSKEKRQAGEDDKKNPKLGQLGIGGYCDVERKASSDWLCNRVDRVG